MAIVASLAVVAVAAYILVFIIHFGAVMFVAVNTFELSIVGCVHMAIRAYIPFPFMFAGINREILTVVIPIRRFPGCGVVAVFAGGRKLCRLMIGVCGVVVARLMAGNTFRRCIGVSLGMAFNAI